MSNDTKREIKVGDLFMMDAPIDASWSLDHEESMLLVQSAKCCFLVRFYLLAIDHDRDRMSECRMVLEEYIRKTVGPPYQSNVRMIDGGNWLGCQSVTNMENGRFLVNRCISSGQSDLLLRIEFDSEKELNSDLVQMLESVKIIPK
ncbi:MAG: hypothetical protein NTY98_02600 [Verrucomicrobia bacterium]|nr:hypothetical protein [Verrucomicrobiota bacterium]